MKQFIVSWVIDIEGDFTAKEAAQQALRMQRDPDSLSVFFSVQDKETGETVSIDLFDEEGDDETPADALEHMPVTARVQ